MKVEDDATYAKRQLLKCLNEAYERALRLGMGKSAVSRLTILKTSSTSCDGLMTS